MTPKRPLANESYKLTTMKMQYNQLLTLKDKYEKLFDEFTTNVGSIEEVLFDHQSQFVHFAASDQFKDYTPEAKREAVERAFELQKLLLGIHYAHHPNRTPQMYFDEKVAGNPCGYWRAPNPMPAVTQ